MSYTASLVDGTIVEIVDKVYEGQKQVLLDADGNRYIRRATADYLTPVEVAEALKEKAADLIDAVEEKVEDVIEAVKDEVEDVVEAVKDAVTPGEQTAE